MEPIKGSIFVIRECFLNYTSLDSIAHFKESAQIVDEAGFVLVELQIVPQHKSVHVTAVIASKDVKKDIGVADCSKVHHALQPKLISILDADEDNFYMEVCSPGMERNIKNAAEFAVFVGREVRVWDKTVGDWVSGVIKCADEKQVTLTPLSADEKSVDTENNDSGEKSVAYDNIAKAKFIHL